MIYQASFKGLLLPKTEKQIIVPQLNTVYQVQVFKDEGPKSTTYKARIVGGGRLDVRANDPDGAKVKAEGLFNERVSEWEQVG
jgi:hypothetical protein